MVIEARQMLIKSGETLLVSDSNEIFGFAAEFLGFEDLTRVKVGLPGDSIQILVPKYEYGGTDRGKRRQEDYLPEEAEIIMEKGEPVLAVIKGKLMGTVYNEETKTHEMITSPVFSIVDFTKDLDTNYKGLWPGKDMIMHEQNLKLGLEIMSIEKQGEEIMVSFPEGEAV